MAGGGHIVTAGALLLAACGARTGLDAPHDGSVRGFDASSLDADVGSDGRPPPVDAAPDVPGRDAGLDADCPDTGPPPPPPPCRRPVPVDMLLVIDDSSSMLGAQSNLAEQLPLLVRSLVTPPDHDGDGRGDWPAPTDLHIGVVSTSGRAASCATAADGRLIPTGECGGSGSRRYLGWRSGDAVEPVTDTFACMATVGATGCEQEQSLNTALRALLPRSAPFDSCTEGDFEDRTVCKGDGPNEGFLRGDSLLVLMLLTNEDDASELEIGGAELTASGFVEAMRWLRPNPERFVYALIAGVPRRLVAEPGEADPATIRSAPELDNDPPDPSCEGVGGIGFSPRKLIDVAARLDDRDVIGSVCSESYEPVVGAAARFIGTRACDD